MELLEINESNIDFLLEKFGKEVNEEGFIIDKETKEKVTCRYTGREIKKETLGGILPGSEIFIEDSDIAYAGYVAEFLTNND
ncbi:MAG: hypothetical protein HY514_00705 [Candidatus Aenigmarchaeota archaeon]|nr:hypothetical protein [Candidatus Aenigmarchaeota archaeon]